MPTIFDAMEAHLIRASNALDDARNETATDRAQKHFDHATQPLNQLLDAALREAQRLQAWAERGDER